MTAPTLVLATHDDHLARRWHALGGRWPIVRANRFDALPAGARLALIDATLPDLPPFEDPRWQQLSHSLRMVFASSQPNDAEGLGAIDAGCTGYCHAFASLEQLTQVLDVVEAGELWVGKSILNRLLKAVGTRAAPTAAPGWAAGLTEREIEVARRAALGEANADIAIALSITERTVKAHLSSIFEKLGVSDRLQLALRVHGIK
ncbi:response regulator transcription factor [Niveibacterium umoris]|uniref:DNA-binding NarL/FixJ family response regulator n=1 Tax=Niveibacterium umoris TaxID=1193620 RepID=A0A840BMY4_9RHOO|nr:response regulator transcription factor [Niveibacterium umoris]MBB4014881.1 DNA-binding NarL/FixJ family response regulator [Niveibacterium umoris]